jgi:hypothetical protein
LPKLTREDLKEIGNFNKLVLNAAFNDVRAPAGSSPNTAAAGPECGRD